MLYKSSYTINHVRCKPIDMSNVTHVTKWKNNKL